MKLKRTIGTLMMSCVLALPAALFAEGAADQRRRQQDQQSERSERQQMRFRGMDSNNDGVITRDEWRGSLRSFRRHDRNNDGVLSGNEVWADDTASSRQRTGDRRDGAPSTLEDAFERQDQDNDGILSRSEWSSDRATFARVDVNRDGVITRPEFLGEGWEEVAATTGRSEEADGVRRDSASYQAGYDRGLTDGRQAGREDRRIDRWDLDGQRELEQADAGYEPSLGPREDYQSGYRAGFRVGYHQGFGSRPPGR